MAAPVSVQGRNLPSWTRGAPRAAAVVALLAWSLFPILWIVLTSLKTRLEILADEPVFWFTPTLDAYRRTLFSPGAGVLSDLLNSVGITMASTVATILVAGLAAYSLARFAFRGKGPVLTFILASRLLPPISAVIPLFLLFSTFGLIDTHAALILVYTALNAPFAAWLLKSFFEGVPKELEEAAELDGCSALGAFFRVTMRLAAPGIVATGIITGNMAWNEFLFAFMFTSVDATTLPLALAELKGGEQIAWQDLGARATLLMLPALTVGLWSQKYLVSGLTAGSLK
ncbi:carbohydrate ABC transporter permease [Occultella gossypii]|uniref:Carbohydrate ABC transporter permease n=1 Tax=Occultella gossypii TaxID=2800820 RepID=A0ABS7S832_9MICO|nr:carbohydrate ABC transporter permease [Occultella gossypii]MBZ2195431.1 carbohydrate ABC transporter permease [Occultella gossypii]